MKFYNEPTQQEIRVAATKLVHPQHMRVFLEQLENPHWIAPLRELGAFSNPPQPIRNETEGSIQYRYWPALKFLTRAAESGIESIQNQVAEVLQGIETDDPFVRYEIARIASKLPIRQSESVAKTQTKWIKTQHSIFHGCDGYQELILHLVAGDAIVTALQLFWSLASFSVDLIPGDDQQERYFRVETGLRIKAYEYSNLVQAVAPSLVERMPMDFLRQLSGELKRFFEWKYGADADYDLSEIWRREIAVEEDRGSGELPDTLVTWIRNAAVEVSQSRDGLEVVLSQLRSYNRPVFIRIALFVLSVSKYATPEDLQSLLDLESLVDEGHSEPEAWLAVSSLWANLGLLKAPILDRIEAGPDLSEFISSNSERHGSPPSEEECELQQKYWRGRNLGHIWDVLAPEELSRFTRFEDDVQAWRNYRREAPMGAFTPKSPKTAEELLQMDDAQLLDYLTNWQPQPFEYWKARESLGWAWSAAIEMEPQRFARFSIQLSNLPRDILWRTLDGFANAVKNGKAFELRPVLELTSTVLATQLAEENSADSIAMAQSLVDAILKSDALTREITSTLWRVLRVPLEAVRPDPSQEATDSSGSRDWLLVGINAPRSRAVEQCIQLLLWMRRYKEEFSPDEHLVWGECSGEVFRRLDPKVEGSLAVRAVFGRMFPWLAAAFGEQDVALRDAIFPLGVEDKPRLDSAWTSYLIYSRFFDDTYRLLRPTYAEALSTLEDDDDEDKAAFAASWHVLTGRIRGLEPSGPNDLVHLLLDRAGPKLLRRLVLRLGYTFDEDKADLPKEIKDRFMTLWEEVKEVLARHPDGKYNEVAAGFGSWFLSDLDKAWLIDNLEFALHKEPKIERGHKVLERLQDYVEVEPRRVASITLTLIQSPPDRWAMSLWQEPLAEILKRTIRSSDSETAELAKQAQAVCIRAGLLEFRSL